MNRIKTLASLIVAAILITPSLIAQEYGFEANVPFQFSVNNKTFPSGEYHFSHQGAFFYIQNSSTVITTVAFAGNHSYDGTSRLVFDRVNGQYFLRKLVTPSSSSSMELAASRTEKRVLAELVAANSSGMTTVNIPAGAE